MHVNKLKFKLHKLIIYNINEIDRTESTWFDKHQSILSNLQINQAIDQKQNDWKQSWKQTI